jgi:sulfonate transport system permease protein
MPIRAYFALRDAELSGLLPAPLDVLRAAVKSVRSGELLSHRGVSALRAAVGLALGSTIGLVLGLASGLSRRLQLVLDTPLQMLRAVPPLALVPLVILWFGLGETAKLFMVVVAVICPVGNPAGRAGARAHPPP